MNNDNIKIPQYDIEIEKFVLGAILTEQGAEIAVISILAVDSFYSEANKLIYKAILQLSTQQQAIDLLTVTERVRANGDLERVGGVYYIAELTQNVGSAANIEYHARIIQQKYIMRELNKFANILCDKSADVTENIEDVLEFAEKSIFEIANNDIKKAIQSSSDILTKCVNRISLAAEKSGAVIGVPSGFSDLDKITNGWQNSDLIIVAGRPAMGKTAFVLSQAKNMSKNNYPVLFFSLEMSSEQLMNRIISAESQIENDKIRSGQMYEADWQRLEAVIPEIQKLKLFIDDTAAISLFELRSKALQMKQKHGISCIIIDYLQLMTISNRDFKGNREQEVATISRGLKQLAKELDVPIIALSQLSRNTVQRGGDLEPRLSDLRDSGAIEQDADIVCFIHRPEYYGIQEDENGESTAGIAKVIIAKYRNGATGTIDLKFISRFAAFENLNL